MDWIPMRWPGEWSHPSALQMVKNTPINCLLADRGAGLAATAGITVLDAVPQTVTLVKGEWPGVRMGQGKGETSAGPTGAPWVDSNGWRARLARARHPSQPVWVEPELPKQPQVILPAVHLLGIADAAMHGGRWVLTLDPDLARAIAAGKPDAMAAWKRITGALRFFAARKARENDRPVAVVGVLSDFSGGNEFLGGEVLNLTARLHQSYRILDIARPVTFDGLKAVIYPDADAPSSGLRAKLLAFVESGGLLVAGAKFATEGRPAAETHPRYSIRTLGKGRIVTGDMQDPFQVAQDAQVLLSHRHDLVRFWNGGAMGSYLTKPADGKSAWLQIVNYTGRPGGGLVSARVAGAYREARIQQLEDAEARPLKALPHGDSIELHLPPIPIYAAVELV
jgi:hypothetical protein